MSRARCICAHHQMPQQRRMMAGPCCSPASVCGAWLLLLRTHLRDLGLQARQVLVAKGGGAAALAVCEPVVVLLLVALRAERARKSCTA